MKGWPVLVEPGPCIAETVTSNISPALVLFGGIVTIGRYANEPPPGLYSGSSSTIPGRGKYLFASEISTNMILKLGGSVPYIKIRLN